MSSGRRNGTGCKFRVLKEEITFCTAEMHGEGRFAHCRPRVLSTQLGVGGEGLAGEAGSPEGAAGRGYEGGGGGGSPGHPHCLGNENGYLIVW